MRRRLASCVLLSSLVACDAVPARPPVTPAPPPVVPPPTPAEVPARIAELKSYSFERLVSTEDIERASIEFHHIGQELDAFYDDDFRTPASGIALGIEDQQLVIFTTRCAVDFEWPNFEVRWRNVHDYEDGGPEFVNEGFVFPGRSKNGGNEWFTHVESNLITATDADGPGFAMRAATFREARRIGDVARVQQLRGQHGELSDVALLLLPIRADSTVVVPNLGFERPIEAAQQLVEKQATLFGIEFEFSCPECQRVTRGYVSREKKAFIAGFGVGLVTGAIGASLVERLLHVDDALAAAKPITGRFEPGARLASSDLRASVLLRDNERCYYARLGMCDPATCWACIASDLHVDHIVAYARGGRTIPENLVTACAACNLSKGAKVVSEWLAADR